MSDLCGTFTAAAIRATSMRGPGFPRSIWSTAHSETPSREANSFWLIPALWRAPHTRSPNPT